MMTIYSKKIIIKLRGVLNQKIKKNLERVKRQSTE